MTLLAIDPGRSVKPSIGWSLFSTDPGHELMRGELTWDQLVIALQPWTLGTASFFDHEGGWTRVHEVVIENFINNPKSRGGQTNGTSEVIGAVEFFCAQNEVPFTRQPNTILPVAKLQAGYTDTHKHLPHEDAAFLHGFHYLVGKGVLEEKGLRGTVSASHTNRSNDV